MVIHVNSDSNGLRHGRYSLCGLAESPEECSDWRSASWVDCVYCSRFASQIALREGFETWEVESLAESWHDRNDGEGKRLAFEVSRGTLQAVLTASALEGVAYGCWRAGKTAGAASEALRAMAGDVCAEMADGIWDHLQRLAHINPKTRAELERLGVHVPGPKLEPEPELLTGGGDLWKLERA